MRIVINRLFYLEFLKITNGLILFSNVTKLFIELWLKNIIVIKKWLKIKISFLLKMSFQTQFILKYIYKRNEND